MQKKVLAWLLLCAPGVWLGWLILQASSAVISPLGADPAEYVVRYLGEWGLRTLLLTLLLSSVARRFGYPRLIRFRRLVGLFALFYLSLHFAGYLWLFAGARLGEIISDLTDRPYITAGFVAWLTLLPLAITSTRAWQRRLGRNWRRLHRGVYVAVLAGTLHLFWLTKDGYAEVLLYAFVGAALLAERWLSLRHPKS
jgi:sulfoxide reductase heme-binding subunit YedZ